MKIKFSFSLNSAMVTSTCRVLPPQVFPVSSTAVSLLFSLNYGVMLLSLLTSPWMAWLSQLGPDCSLFQWLSPMLGVRAFIGKVLKCFFLRVQTWSHTVNFILCSWSYDLCVLPTINAWYKIWLSWEERGVQWHCGIKLPAPPTILCTQDRSGSLFSKDVCFPCLTQC